MKIVFVLPGRSRSSGGVRVTSIVANGLLARGHHVRILYRRPEQTFRSRCVSLRNKIWYSRAPDWLGAFRGQTGSFAQLAECYFEPNEMIVGVGIVACAAMRFLHSLPNVKVLYIHGLSSWNQDLLRTALSLPYPKILVSSDLERPVREYGGGEILAVIQNGVDRREYLNPVRDSEKDGIGTIYSCHPSKDPTAILSVLEALSRRRPDLPIRVFGADRRPMQLSRRVYCRYPSLEQAREIYSHSLVWILASRSEGFPAPPLEAMACGCVVVTTDCGGTRDVIVDGKNGFLVEVGDVEGIVRRVELLLDDHTLRERMRREAQRTVDYFTWERCIDGVEAALEKASHASQLSSVLS